MLKQRIARLTISLLAAMSLMIAGSVTVLAAAPSVEDVEYKGKGRVEVDFRQDVSYKKSVKITVKDTSGKKYKVKNVWKDDDEIKFTIKNFKKGKKYKITIKGVKQWGTSGYGKVKTSVKIPAPAKGNKISKSKAIEKAKNHAKNTWKGKNFRDVEAEKDYYNGQSVWEVEFNGTINGKPYEFEYKIAVNGGKILKSKKEWDD